MEYLFKASGIVIILFFFYILFLKNETFFKSIRSYFIIGLVITLSIPLIEIPIYVESTISNLNLNNFEVINSSSTIEQSINWSSFLITIYLIGVLFFSLKFLIQLFSLIHLIYKNEIIKTKSYYFIETSKDISPFSFFKLIIYNKSQFTIEELEHIVNHEKAHVNQWHSIDTILAHLLVITLWFNPFVWLYKKAVQQNLEFLADDYALNLTNNQKLYQFTLLKICSSNYCTAITNNFYNSLIKKRIIMLHKNRSTNKNQWKYALLIPLLALFIFSFNTTTIAQNKKLIEIEELNEIKAELIINKDYTSEMLEKEKKFFKKEFHIDLTFKGIKRNSSNEITAIRINAKSKNSSASFANSGSRAIKPILISFDSEQNSIAIGNLKRKIHKNVWVHKGDHDSNVTVEVTEDRDHKRKAITKEHNVFIETNDNEDHEIEVIVESDDNDHNVFVIKTDGDKIKKHKIQKKGNFVFVTKDEREPLYFVDGKEISSEEMKKVDPDSIKTMEVLKGKSATKKYGKKAKGGVILIITKNK